MNRPDLVFYQYLINQNNIDNVDEDEEGDGEGEDEGEDSQNMETGAIETQNTNTDLIWVNHTNQNQECGELENNNGRQDYEQNNEKFSKNYQNDNHEK